MDFLKKQKGFTLMEVIVSVFVIAVGIFGAVSMFPFGVKTIKSSQETTVSMQLLQEKIENAISQSYSSLVVGSSTESLVSPFEGFSRTTKISYVDPTAGLAEIVTDKGLKKIEVTVSRRSLFGAGNKSITATTLASQK